MGDTRALLKSPGDNGLATTGEVVIDSSTLSPAPRHRGKGKGSREFVVARPTPVGAATSDPASPVEGAEAVRSPAGPEGKGEEALIHEWPATALSGNDLMSSCLYTIGLVTQYSGKVAPFAFLAVAVVLYFFRSIYAMAVLSFPKNGGSYNLLTNVAPPALACLGACLSIVSYAATCVVSAVTACEYLGRVFNLHVPTASCVLLAIFALLAWTGIKESATIAFAIFAVHMISLTVLCLGCFAMAASEGFSILTLNYEMPLPDAMIGGGQMKGTLATAAFMGFSSAMLGVSGFETSAQFVESMHRGVFVKTLRNMWIGVTIYNPLLSLLALSVLPMGEIARNSDTVLAKMAMVWGDWLFGEESSMAQLMTDWMSLDAFIVLSGAVLTAFVGVDGLVYQMASEKCLPQLFLHKNKWRGTNHYIIFGFLALCVSQVVMMKGDVHPLATIYSLAFLGVMATFTLGAMLLKSSPRYAQLVVSQELDCPWWHLGLALILVLIALGGTLAGKDTAVLTFLGYFGTIYGVCLLCLYREQWAACAQGSNARQGMGSGVGAVALDMPCMTPAQEGNARSSD